VNQDQNQPLQSGPDSPAAAESQSAGRRTRFDRPRNQGANSGSSRSIRVPLPDLPAPVLRVPDSQPPLPEAPIEQPPAEPAPSGRIRTATPSRPAVPESAPKADLTTPPIFAAQPASVTRKPFAPELDLELEDIPPIALSPPIPVPPPPGAREPIRGRTEPVRSRPEPAAPPARPAAPARREPATRPRGQRPAASRTSSAPPPTLEHMRPASLDEVVGQSQAVRSLISKVASPYPRHVILYGPPGVGKASVARLALEKVKTFSYSFFSKDSPFVEVDAATLGQDPQALFMPVRHRGGKEKDGGLELGAVGRAHGGILFVNEISELSAQQLSLLLRVIDNRKIILDPAALEQAGVRLTAEERRQVQEGLPAAFVLVASTASEPEKLPAALRARCGEVFFRPLFPAEIAEIVTRTAERLGVSIDEEAAALVGRYTNVGRRAVELLLDAVGLASLNPPGRPLSSINLGIEQFNEIAAIDRMVPVSLRPQSGNEIQGRVIALGSGRYAGFPVEIEVSLFPAARSAEGLVHCAPEFREMVEEAVDNSAAVIRALLGTDLNDHDIYVRIHAYGRGDLAGFDLPICLALMSVLKNQPLPADVALTGRISLQGGVLPVERALERVIGAQAAGFQTIILPLENRSEISAQVEGVNLVPVMNVQEAFATLAGTEGASGPGKAESRSPRRSRGRGRGHGRR